MSNISVMTSFISTQVQVYHYLIQHPEGYILQYSKVEAYEFGLLPPLEGIPTANEQNGPSLELLLVGLIFLLLPIFSWVAFRLGKKAAKNQNSTQNGSNFKRKGSNTNPDDSRDLATQTRHDISRALVLYEKINSPLVLPSNSICEASQQTEEDYQEESPIRLESKNYSEMEMKPCIESQSTRPGSSSSEQESLNINGCESSVMNLGDEGKLGVPKFEVNMVRQYSVEQKNADEMVNALNEEKLKLHTNEEQVSKVEIKYHLSFETKDGNLHKIEKQEIKTIYAKGCKEPENNAVMLKNAYENYQNDPATQSECGFLNKSSECKSPSTALVPVSAFQRNVMPACTENKLCLIPTTASEKVIESCVENNKIKEIETAKSSEVKAPAFQIDDIPHETGKFAKIFKNVEEIGEGGFGRVYRVVHKLDGKIYAVKKALLKLDSFEDLQQKSKVFREVFAMTDLHHPNIVRYSTCWVEIEKGKGKKRQPKAKSQVKAMETQSVVTEEQSESQSQSQSQSQQSESESSHTNASSVGFEWDLGENQDSKTQESAEKKRLEIVARKMENSIMRSLTMTYNDEKSIEDSSPSHMYQTGNTEYFEGYNLYLYIQMEYCSGQNLRDYLDSLKRECSNKKTLGMFRKILEGVYAIHKRGIFHRDLKPANIFLDENENIKIGDFGLASLGNNEESKEPHETKHIDGNLDKSYSKTVGTPMYASPEQACGGRYNHKTDIYSLGFILAEMLAGLSTHHERYQLFRLLRDSHELSANFKAKYPKESELIMRMTSFSPDERPTAEELIVELDKLLGDGNSTGKELACR